MDDVKKFISENGLGEISENMSFKDCTTLKVGGKISLFYYPNTVENFLIFHDYFRPSGRPLFIIGSGSNVFAADDDFEGVVVSFKKLPSNTTVSETFIPAIPLFGGEAEP